MELIVRCEVRVELPGDEKEEALAFFFGWSPAGAEANLRSPAMRGADRFVAQGVACFVRCKALEQRPRIASGALILMAKRRDDESYNAWIFSARSERAQRQTSTHPTDDGKLCRESALPAVELYGSGEVGCCQRIFVVVRFYALLATRNP